MEQKSLTLQHCAIIGNSFARADLRDSALFACLGRQVLELARTGQIVAGKDSVQAMTLLANAFARLGEFENAQGEEVFRQLAQGGNSQKSVSYETYHLN